MCTTLVYLHMDSCICMRSCSSVCNVCNVRVRMCRVLLLYKCLCIYMCKCVRTVHMCVESVYAGGLFIGGVSLR